MSTTEMRDALVEKLSSDWDMDPFGEYDAARKRLSDDLDALIAAVRAETLAGSGVECGLVGCDLLELLIGILAEGPNGEYATIDAMERAAKAIHMEWHEAQGRWITTDRTRPFQPATPPTLPGSDDLARTFHEQYERLAPSFGYFTRRDSSVPWQDVPEPNKSLMLRVATEVLERWPFLAATPPTPAPYCICGCTLPPTPALTALCSVSVLRPDGGRQYCVHRQPCPDHAIPPTPALTAARLAAALDAVPWEPVKDPMDMVTYEEAARQLLAALATSTAPAAKVEG